MQVFVVRHTKVKVEEGLCYGQYDVPLADTFIEEVELIKAKLPTCFDVVFCSPLKRCSLLAGALQVEKIIYENALLEMNFGEWEGKKWDTLNSIELQIWMQNFLSQRPPGGENLIEFYKRVSKFMNSLRKMPYQRVLMITHAGVVRCLWTYFLKVPLKNIFRIPVIYGQVMGVHMGKTLQEDWIFRYD